MIQETLKCLCAILILTAKIQFYFSFDEKPLYEFYSVDIVCKQIRQCNERLTSDINLERYVETNLHVSVYLESNIYSRRGAYL